MKSIILMSLLIVSTTYAADYSCRVSAFKLDMHTNNYLTDLTVRDAQSGEYFYSGIVSEMIDRDGKIDLIFETRSYTFFKIAV